MCDSRCNDKNVQYIAIHEILIEYHLNSSLIAVICSHVFVSVGCISVSMSLLCLHWTLLLCIASRNSSDEGFCPWKLHQVSDFSDMLGTPNEKLRHWQVCTELNQGVASILPIILCSKPNSTSGNASHPFSHRSYTFFLGGGGYRCRRVHLVEIPHWVQ